MRTFFGVVMIVAGIVLGLYAGLWWAFIGGIVQVIEQIRSPELSAISVALGIARVFFAGFIGWVSAAILVLPGVALTDHS